MAASAFVQEGTSVAVYVQVRPSKEKLQRGTTIREEGEWVNLSENSKYLFLGNGRSQMGRSQFFNSKKGVGVVIDEPIYKSVCLNGLFEDKMYLQNIPSIVAARVLEVKRGDRVLG